jgi:hypothetical protein
MQGSWGDEDSHWGVLVYGTVQSGKWEQRLGGTNRRGGSVGAYSNTAFTSVRSAGQQGMAELRNGKYENILLLWPASGSKCETAISDKRRAAIYLPRPLVSYMTNPIPYRIIYHDVLYYVPWRISRHIIHISCKSYTMPYISRHTIYQPHHLKYEAVSHDILWHIIPHVTAYICVCITYII